MARPLGGLKVVEVSGGMAGAITAMLLGDYGAEVIKVEPGPVDARERGPGALVHDRGKRSVTLDLASPAGARDFGALAATADIVIESFAPGLSALLGIDDASLRRSHDRLIHCSITGYGRHGPSRARPAIDALVQARAGLQDEQPGWRDGPIFLRCPLPTYGAALAASAAINAALHAREVTGTGQWVETSLMQGSLLWMTQIWKRAETPTPELTDLWKFKGLGPTPCYQGSDGQWFHPMPDGVAVALAHLGRDPGEIPAGGLASGDLGQRTRYFTAVAELYRQRPAGEWVELLQSRDVPCQPVRPVEAAFDHAQLRHNHTVIDVEVPRVGLVSQFGWAYHLEYDDEVLPAPAPDPGQHTDETLSSLAQTPARAQAAAQAPAGPGPLAHPLSGITVLDFGTAVAGPFATMILGDLGAEVIKIGPTAGAGGTGDAVWVAGQRGKQSLAVDLKRPEGQRIAEQLIATADVIHYNLRTGVAERLGFGLEQARRINPRIIFCHLTGYGSTGPLARWPGVDQMGQALCGLEHEQGATPSGGQPTWYRFGMCDAVAGMFSVLGVLQALYYRDRTGEGQRVETNILSAAMLLVSDATAGPATLPPRAQLDRDQMGLGPLHRLYRAADDGWLCLAVGTDEQWRALTEAVAEPQLGRDARFATAPARDEHADALAAMLAAVFRARPVAEWFDRLDGHGVPCEMATGTRGADWYDDPEAIANGWVAAYPHPVWGRLEQPGRFFDLSATPGRVLGPPPLIGQHTRDILLRLGYRDDEADRLRARGVVGW